jgi:hypothetical protein
VTDLETLVGRVQALEDTLAIQDVMAKYGRLLDTGAWDEFRGLFTDDIRAVHDVVTEPLAGLDTFMAVAQQLSELMEDAQHYVTNVEVDLDGDEAVARAFVFAMHDVALDGERQLVPAGGRYENRLRRTPDGWKIFQLTVHETWLDERVGKIYAG